MGWNPRCYIPSFVEIGPPVPEKKIFEGFLPYMGVASILVMWPRCPRTNFCSPFPMRLHIKFGFDWPSGFREEDVWNCEWRTTTDADGRTPNHGYTPYWKWSAKLHWNSLKFHWKSVRWKIVVIFGEISLIFQWNSVTKIRSLKFQWNATEFHWNINELTETSMDFTEFHWHITAHWNVTEILIAQWNIQLETCIHFFS